MTSIREQDTGTKVMGQFPLSPRGHPLVDLPIEGVLQLTADLYPKWYIFYILHPDGRVDIVSTQTEMKAIEAAGALVGDCVYVDHVYHPAVLIELAKILGVCRPSDVLLEMALGRWLGMVASKITLHAESSDNIASFAISAYDTIETTFRQE